LPGRLASHLSGEKVLEVHALPRAADENTRETSDAYAIPRTLQE